MMVRLYPVSDDSRGAKVWLCGRFGARAGVKEGEPMSEWFQPWVDGLMTPEGAESFAALQARGVAAVNRALALPAPVLVVAHGALFRSLRAAMGLSAQERLMNATPMFCEPGTPWTLSAA